MVFHSKVILSGIFQFVPPSGLVRFITDIVLSELPCPKDVAVKKHKSDIINN